MSHQILIFLSEVFFAIILYKKNDCSQQLKYFARHISKLRLFTKRSYNFDQIFFKEKKLPIFFNEIHEFFEVYEKVKNIRIGIVLSHARTFVKNTNLNIRLPSEKYNQLHRSNYDISHL